MSSGIDEFYLLQNICYNDLFRREVQILKRYQVLLPDWLEDYVKFLVDKHDLSFSEILRAEICFSILCSVTHLFPEYKLDLTCENMLTHLETSVGNDINREDMHQMLSRIYFETRKATEHRLAKEKGKNKK